MTKSLVPPRAHPLNHLLAAIGLKMLVTWDRTYGPGFRGGRARRPLSWVVSVSAGRGAGYRGGWTLSLAWRGVSLKPAQADMFGPRRQLAAGLALVRFTRRSDPLVPDSPAGLWSSRCFYGKGAR